ncbi:carbohydrate-binding protein [Jiangella aurantiaca]|uniref:Carbohydrate-binding protein n=1 Tax=Jiangella aurantiaca TaxID=2530373 RepID=A0A4R5AJ74_9ACTN|nr:carbohydrate-binding protein [Jiangella aurantiaca]
MRRLYRYLTFTVVAAFLAALFPGIATSSAHTPEAGYEVLFFHKTTGFRHDSIPAALAAVQALGADHGFTVTETQDASVFTDESLSEFEAVVFYTDGENTLTTPQRTAFERYIQRGGGFVGLHSTSNTDKSNWPWWKDMFGGAFFVNHPPIQSATVKVEDPGHPATAQFGSSFQWPSDEFYNFSANPRAAGVKVLLTVDESTYNGGQMGADHPVSWCSVYDGGRSFYTALGHSASHYADPGFRQHIGWAIEWAAGTAEGDCGEPREGIPTAAAFEKVALDDNTANPMKLDIASDGRIFYTELAGAVKVYHPDTQQISTAGQIPVYRGQENGLIGIALDPAFEENNFLYLFYSDPASRTVDGIAGGVQHVSRFTLDPLSEQIDLDSEVVLLEIPHQRVECCHTGGHLDFDAEGNLYISTGDDTNPFASGGFGPFDYRPGRQPWDAARSSGNAADLRGKILRINPIEDATSDDAPGVGSTFDVPDDNLFTSGEHDDLFPGGVYDPALGRPEIYVMGLRNPFTLDIDQETGVLTFGLVGPDANPAGGVDPNRGPRGYDYWAQVHEASNYGWPFCIVNSQPYRHFDFATNVVGEPYDCVGGPVNDSPNNTGIDRLPPVEQLPTVYYPYCNSQGGYTAPPPYPEVPCGPVAGGSAYGTGRAAYAGDTYHFDPAVTADGRFPAFFDGKPFVMEWERDFIATMDLDANGNYVNGSLREQFYGFRFEDSQRLRKPHDMEFGPDGNLYLIEWGDEFNFGGGGVNPDSGLYRISYVKDGRTPTVHSSATPDNGQPPVEVTFSSEGTFDADGDEITFEWSFGDGATSTEPNPTHTYTEAGVYTAQLVVTDTTGRSASSNLTITVGNTEPEVSIELPAHGQVFEWGDEVPFRVSVTDAEDGSTADGTIDCADVTVQQGVYHDTGGAVHVHQGASQNGCEGTILTDPESGHEGQNVTVIVTASYTDEGDHPDAQPLTGGNSHLLRPARTEAEHFSESTGVVTGPGSDPLGGGETMRGADGDWASYDPVSLGGVESLDLRVSALADTTVEVRRDAPDGPLLGTAEVPATTEIGRVPGKDGFGNAVQFNSGGANRYAELPVGVVSDLTGDFTIATWINRAATGQDWSRIFDFGSGTGVNMFLTPNAGGAPGLRYAIKPQGASEQQITYNQELPAGWHHVAVTLSGTTGTLWLDGAPVATNANMTFNPAELGETTQNWLIRSQYAADPYLNATLDEFHIFDSALTQAQLQALMAGPAGEAGGNVVAYDVDETGGPTLADSSGRGNDGSIVLNPAVANWTDVTVDLAPTEGSTQLYLVFPGAEANVNWLHLNAGPGVQVPTVSATVAPAEPDGQDGWYVTPVTVTLSADDPDADIEYRVGEGEWTAYTGPVTLDEDGTHTVAYRATNAAGTSEAGTVEVAVDVTAPETTATVEGDLDGDVYLGPATLTLAATDAASGAVETHYRLAGDADHTVYSGPVTLDPAAVYEVEYRSVDAAGNVGDWQQSTVVVADTMVIVGGIDSGVANRTVSSGTTINDLILDEQPWSSRGAFLRHVTEVTQQLQADGVITGREASSIQRAAARSDVGRSGGSFALG